MGAADESLPAAAAPVRDGGASDAVGDTRPHRGSGIEMGPAAATSLAVSLARLTALSTLDLRCLCGTSARARVCVCRRVVGGVDAVVWRRRPAARDSGSRRRRVKHKSNFLGCRLPTIHHRPYAIDYKPTYFINQISREED